MPLVAFLLAYVAVLLILTGSILALAEMVGAVRLLLAVCVDKRRKALDWPRATAQRRYMDRETWS